MNALFLKLLNMSITAGWLVLAVLVLRLLLKKAPRWIHCALWVLVAVRLVLPFSIESIFSLIPSTQTIPDRVLTGPRFEINTGFDFVNSRVNEYLGTHYFEGVTVPVNNGANTMNILAVMWLIGMALMLAYTVFSYGRIRRQVREAARLEGNVWVCDTIQTPFILGVFAPKIYLPSTLSNEDTSYVLSHERAHLKRLDHIWKPLGFLLLTVYWFNPLLWLGYIFLCRDIELACDEKVIKEQGSDIKKPYSEALINCSVPRKWITACPLAFGEVGVKARIKSVLNYKKPAFWIVLAALVALCVTAVCFLTNPPSRRLQNIEHLTLEKTFQNASEIYYGDGSSYRNISVFVDREALLELGKTRISKIPVSQNRSEDRDKTHTLILQMPEEAQPSIQSYLKGCYIHFNEDFSQVWIDTLVKPTLSYRVLDPQKAKSLYHEACGIITLTLAGESECEGVSVNLVAAVLDVEHPYVEIQWVNDTDKSVSFGEDFRVYKDGQLYEPTQDMFVNAILCEILPGGSTTQKIYLTSYDLYPGLYTIKKEFYHDNKKYYASVPFFVEVPSYFESYIYEGTRYDKSGVSLNTQDKTFTMTLSMFSSLIPYGTYTEEDDKLILRDSHSQDVLYTFQRKGDTLIFLADESSPMPSYRYNPAEQSTVCVPDKAVFKLTKQSAYPEPAAVLCWFECYPAAGIHEFDDYSNLTVNIEAFPETTFSYDNERYQVLATENGKTTALYAGMPVWDVFFYDVTGDGKPELCSEVSYGSGIVDDHIVVYDYVQKELYTLWDRMEYNYNLTYRDNALYAIKTAYIGGEEVERFPLTLDVLTKQK